MKDSQFNFYLNTKDSQDMIVSCSILGINDYDNTSMNLEIRMDQQITKNQNGNLATFSFKTPFPNGCKMVKVMGKVIVTLGNSQQIQYPLGVVLPSNTFKDKFSIIAPPMENVEYSFQVNYTAIGW